MQFHDGTREALKDSIFDIEKENLFLKERIKELEKYLIPKPLFVGHFNAIQLVLSLEYVPETHSRLKGSSRSLMIIRKYIGDGIKKIIDLILET
jgi:hypothetical protein